MDRLVAALQSVTLSEDQIEVRAMKAALSVEALSGQNVKHLDAATASIRIAFHMRRRQHAVTLEAADGTPGQSARIDRALVRAVVLAKAWSRQLESGDVLSIKALARREGLCNHYTARLLPLAYLAPDIAETILAGRQGYGVSLAGLTAQPLPFSWSAQRDLVAQLGMRAG